VQQQKELCIEDPNMLSRSRQLPGEAQTDLCSLPDLNTSTKLMFLAPSSSCLRMCTCYSYCTLHS
jgi:hypothetical protein